MIQLTELGLGVTLMVSVRVPLYTMELVVLSSLMNLTPSTSKASLGLGSNNYVKLLAIKLVLKSGAERCIKNSSIWGLYGSRLIG